LSAKHYRGCLDVNLLSLLEEVGSEATKGSTYCSGNGAVSKFISDDTASKHTECTVNFVIVVAEAAFSAARF